jgi:hypothetical protein
MCRRVEPPFVTLATRARAALADDDWRYPIAAGLFALLFTAWDAWPSLYELDPPVFLAAALAAYLYHGRGELDHERVGRRAALVASLPVAWTVVDLVAYQALHATSPPAYRVGFTVLAVSVLAAFWWGVAVVLVGTIGAKFGEWLAANTDLPRPALPAPARPGR